ncbi:metallophosphoesterase [Anatilimnocola floriformis]|uniref:metallophosphoesterase n=1 Tax=Anatilimnocola floriformis TaxID=2948575 RepID=UPI0020C2B98C|nr:metallophosphoesterase [Anatilimnocola floriformis]
MPARTLAIGDIHGCHVAFQTLLALVKPTAEDTLIILGDVVDRGLDTKACIEEILRLQDECLVISIMGNHEEMMRDSIQKSFMMEMWLQFGGDAVLQSYGGGIDKIPPAHLKWLSHLRPFYETPKEIFVHAKLDPWLPLGQQGDYDLRWKKLEGNEPAHMSGKRSVCGHTPQKDGYPLSFDGWVCLDTNCCRGGWLTCLDVTTDHVWQTNEAAQFREFELADYA